jgi:hypothetical protein
MVGIEFGGVEYTLKQGEAELLAQNLRNYGKGVLRADVTLAAQLSRNPNWSDGALATAEFIEEILVGNLDGPLPTEGKAAEAIYWTLRMMVGPMGSTEPRDMAALRDALAEQYQRTAA